MLAFVGYYLLVGVLHAVPCTYLWRKINEPYLSGRGLLIGVVEVALTWVLLWPIGLVMMLRHYGSGIVEKIRGRF